MEAIVHKIYVVVVHTTRSLTYMGREKKALLILCPEDSLQYILSDPLSVQEEPWCKDIALLEFQVDQDFTSLNIKIF